MGYLRARKRTAGAPMRGRTATQRAPQTRAPYSEPRLPHERDESVAPRDRDQAGAAASQRRIEQASEDLARGVQDTERRGVPSDVPVKTSSPGREPARGEAAAVEPRRRPRSRFL
jgi:hypothetical protein